jgi:tetratricopeptide (TPR) repeat protein
MAQLSPKQKEEKVLFFLTRGNHADAISEFEKSFSQENPCSKEFLLRVLSEFNRLKVYEEVFSTLRHVALWFPNDADLVRSEKQAKRNFYFFLCEQANKIITTAHERAARFKEEAAELDKLYREKLLQENQRALKERYSDALKLFEQANLLLPKAFEALFGMANCYKEIGDTESAQRITDMLAELTKTDEPEEIKAEEFAPPENLYSEPEGPINYDIKPLENLYDEGKYDEVLETLDQMLLRNENFVPGLMLKAKIHLQKREFLPAEACLEQATKAEPNNLFVMDFRLDFQDHKFKILTRGGIQFLQKGVQLGPTLGHEFFLKARDCFRQALEITTGDCIILDHLYTVLMYLGEPQAALKVKTEILMYSPQFQTTFEKHRNRSLCFLAGYAFAQEPETIRDFRRFRTLFLLDWPGGIALNTLYHRISPRLITATKAVGITPHTLGMALRPLHQLIRLFLPPAQRSTRLAATNSPPSQNR